MLKKTLTTIVAGFAAMALTPAFAGDQQNVDTCLAAINEAAPEVANEARFHSIKGNSNQRISFDVRTENGRERIQCDVRRGQIADLAWVDDTGVKTALNSSN